MSRRIITSIAAIALIALITPTAARAQTGFGVRYANLKSEGDHIIMDATSAFGAHVALGFLPILKLQVGAEYLSGTADYDYGGVLQLQEQDYKSLGIYADVRYPIKLMPLFPIKPVVGGGVNINLMSYLDRAGVEDFIAGGLGEPDVENFTQIGYHLMFGLLFKPPVLPFTITAEYRLQTIKLTDDTVENNGIVVGLTFGF